MKLAAIFRRPSSVARPTTRLLLVATVAFAVQTDAISDEAGLSKRFAGVDANKPVLCLLPGRVRQLGGSRTYLERRRPAQLTASECEIRGGEYTLYDRANYESALNLWKEEAAQGNAEAHLYVGEIYERGWVGEPDYAEAGRWYTKAADLGSKQGERRLAYLYENGLGVDENKGKALELWRSALGLQDELVLASEVDAAKNESQRRIEGLLAQLEEQNRRTGQLRALLGDAENALINQTAMLNEQSQAIAALENSLQEQRDTSGNPQRIQQLEQELYSARAQASDQQLNIDLLEAELLAQRAQVEASERQAAVRERQLNKAQDELLALSRDGDALLRELEDKDARISMLENNLETLESALAADRQRASELEAQLATSEAGSSTTQSELREKLLLARTAITDGERRLSELRNQQAEERATFEKQLSDANIREAELESILAKSQAENATLTEALRRSTTAAERLDEELADSRGALAETEFELSALRGRLAAAEELGDAAIQLKSEIESREESAASLRRERDELFAALQAAESERNRLRGELASEVDTRTWLNVELESAGRKLARTREDLRLTEIALQDSKLKRERLERSVSRLEEDLALSRSRSDADILALESRLRAAREELAATSTSGDALQVTAARLESDFAYYSERQEERTLAMRGDPVAPAIPASSVSKRNSDYHAIIIANYQYDYLQDLSSPPFDANRLKQILESRYDFSVTVLLNLDRSEMYAALADLRNFDENDRVLIYYAGHGRMDSFGEGYWLPTDFRSNRPLNESISAQDLTLSLQQSPAKHILLVADSCYSGALARNTAPTVRKSVPALVKFWLANRSRTVLTSGGLKPVLDEGPGGHSVFASALLDTLESNSGAINGEMLHAGVYSLVRAEAAKLGYLDQKPQFSAIEDAGHENGQFVFVNRG